MSLAHDSKEVGQRILVIDVLLILEFECGHKVGNVRFQPTYLHIFDEIT